MEMSTSINQRKQWQALNYKTYAEATANFQWKERWDVFDGTKENFNITHECVDRHPGDELALRIKYDDRRTESYTFGQISSLTSKFANMLERNGVKAGDRVAVLLFPSLAFYVSMFGIYKSGTVMIPCFPLFGPEAINFRLENGEVSTIITTKDKTNLIDMKLAERLNLKYIFVEDILGLLADESDVYTPSTSSKDLCMIQFSSGTTGTPKPIRYTHGAISVAAVVMKFAGGLKPDDNYFCCSSPGWGHGIWYGTISPMIFGKAAQTISGKFDPEICLEALEEFEITNIAGISSHFRLMMGTGKADKYNLKLRFLTYSGEKMSRDLIDQIKKTWGLDSYTQFGTTEVGPITLDYGGFDDWVVKPGSVGKPMVGGLKVVVVDEAGNVLPQGQIGQVALQKKDRLERIGDEVYEDEDGYFWYVGRIDDVIISSGYT
ncbi:MAG: AMP-binding protein, partial [Deltaproteobacteria bacterium]|nr:AMP-binding protein [Deltaproteobacteria bacterium]